MRQTIPTAGEGPATGACPCGRRLQPSTKRCRVQSPGTCVRPFSTPTCNGTYTPRMAKRLPGRRVLVVGAGTRSSDDPDAPMGNGRAISVLAAREGAIVACADRDEDAARETARLVGEAGGEAHLIVGDVTDADVC